jgi:hypothetical protein
MAQKFFGRYFEQENKEESSGKYRNLSQHGHFNLVVFTFEA